MKKTFIIYLGLLLALMLSTAANAGLPKSCAFLKVELQGGGGWEIYSSSCLKGTLQTVTSTWLMVVQGPAGIDCDINVTQPAVKWKQDAYSYDVKQDYCLFEAGDITVTPWSQNPKTGGMNYTIHPGSYNERAGQVVFTPKQ